MKAKCTECKWEGTVVHTEWYQCPVCGEIASLDDEIDPRVMLKERVPDLNVTCVSTNRPLTRVTPLCPLSQKSRIALKSAGYYWDRYLKSWRLPY